MPGRPNILPPSGSPASGMGSPMSVLHAVAKQTEAISGFEMQGMMGMAGSQGIHMALPPIPQFRLFEVQGASEADAWSTEALAAADQGYKDPAVAQWWWTKAKEVVYWSQDASPGWHTDAGSTRTDIVWHPVISERDDVDLAPSDEGFSVGSSPSYDRGGWLWCILEPSSGRWVVFGGINAAVRFYVGTTTTAVTTGTNFQVSDLTAVDGGSVPDPDNTSPDTWDVSNDASDGDGYSIDAEVVGKIIGWADGTLHPLDFPCAVGGTPTTTAAPTTTPAP